MKTRSALKFIIPEILLKVKCLRLNSSICKKNKEPMSVFHKLETSFKKVISRF